MEPVITLHPPAAAPSVSTGAATSTSAAQPSAFSPAATFSVVASSTSSQTETSSSSEYPSATRVISPASYDDNLKYHHITSSTDSTCSAAVSTPESKSSDCPPTPKHGDFDPAACSPPQSVTEDRGGYNGGQGPGGGAEGGESGEGSLLPAQATAEAFERGPPTKPCGAVPVTAGFLHMPSALDSSTGDSQAAPVAALLAAAASAASPLGRAAQAEVASKVAEAILRGQATQNADSAMRTEATPAGVTGAADSTAAKAAELSGQQEVDVAIIGAGLAGLTAALAIHKKTGRVVHVFEKEMYHGGESPSLREGAEGWETKLTMEKDSTVAEEIGVVARAGGAEGHERQTNVNPNGKANSVSTPGRHAVSGAAKEADDKEILLQANGLDALCCIDEQLACDVLECGHIVYSDSLDVFDWETKAASLTLVFGVYWSDLRQILYKYCRRYRDIIFVYGKELKAAVGDNCMRSPVKGPSTSAMGAPAAFSSSPPTVSTLLSSPLSSSTISTPSSCSAYPSPSGTPLGRDSTHVTPTKSPNSLKQRHEEGYAEAELSHGVASAHVESGKVQSFEASVGDISTDPINNIKLCFRDGTEVTAKLVVGADGPESCARKPFGAELNLAHKMQQDMLYENCSSTSRSSTIQYQGLTELASGEEVPDDIWLYHKKSGNHVSMMKALGPNILTWSLTSHADQATSEQAQMAESSWKAYALETVAQMKEESSEKTRKAFDMLYRLIERTSQEDIQCFSLSRPAYQSCRWTRLNDKLVLVGNAAHPTPPNIGQSHDLTIEDTVQLAYCLRDWSANDVWAAQRFASIRKQSLSRVLKLSEALFKAIWSNEEVWKHCDGELLELEMDTEASRLLSCRANFVPVRNFLRGNESQALMENAELETEYM